MLVPPTPPDGASARLGQASARSRELHPGLPRGLGHHRAQLMSKGLCRSRASWDSNHILCGGPLFSSGPRSSQPLITSILRQCSQMVFLFYDWPVSLGVVFFRDLFYLLFDRQS